VKNQQPAIDIIDYDHIEIVTTFAPDTEFEGELQFNTPLKIQGKFKGKIETAGFLWIDDNAVVEADIIAGSVKLGGTVKGNIDAKQKIEILPKAKLYGNIKTTKLKIADGVIFEGSCEMLA